MSLSTSPATAASAREAPVEVLLVEDDDGDVLLVRELLDQANVRLRVAPSLAEAMAVLGGADCVLLDLGLPDAHGLDGLHRMRAAVGRVPVVVLTGLAGETHGIAAVAAGAQDYLIKGFVSGHQLIRTIQYAVQRRHVEDIESALLEERLHAEENIRLERGLLPQPVIRTHDVEVISRYQPGGNRMLLGGDFFDVVEDPDGNVHALIGDVAGHGPDQAALGVALRIAWRTLVLADRPPQEVLGVLDRVLVHERDAEELLATVCTVTIAADRARAVAHVAGHPPPLVGDGTRWRPATLTNGPALGLLPRPVFPTNPLALPPTWRLALYTDGLIEGRVHRTAPQRLTVNGLVDLFAAHPGDTAGGIDVDAVVADVTARNGGPLTDDLALLLLVPAGTR